MKVRKAIRKIVALGIGAAMLGATILSASAANLADFPKPLFIGSDGTFNGKFVFGAKAGTEDVLGANAITAAVQAAAVLKTTVSGSGSVVTVTGDSAQISAAGDILELNEELGNVKAVLTSDDLDALKSGTITNQQGTTKYNQYLRLDDTVLTGTGGITVWDQNDANDVGDFLKFASDVEMFEYELEFEEGLESTIDDPSNRLDDLENREFNILGKTLTLTRAEKDGANQQLELTFLGGEWSQVMEEGETTTVKIGDTDYDIEIVIIADTPTVVKFKINGEVTDKLEEGETTKLSDGTTLGVREILPNEAGEEGVGDMVEFFLGANKIVFTDDDATGNSVFDEAGAVEVNDESVTNGMVMIKATLTDTEGTLSDIKYRLKAEPLASEDDVLIPAGKGLRANLKDDTALGMLHTGWDIAYKGLAPVTTSTFKIDASGDNKYFLEFTNVNGDAYSNIPLIDNSGDNFIVGKDSTTDRHLFWVEQASGINNAWIAKNDYFITSSKDETNGITHVLKLDSIETSTNKVQFTDLSLGTIEATYDATTKSGDLILSGKSYLMFVNTTNSKVGVDLDGDGTINALEHATIVIKGGGEVYLGANVTTELNVTGEEEMLITLVTESKLFDESLVEENISFALVPGTTAETVDISLVNSAACTARKFTLENIDDQKDQCMTPYGVLVEEYDPTGTSSAAEMIVTYPEEQRQALVFVEVGTTSTSTTGGGNFETETVVPIPSTASVLDTEVTNPKSQNLIIVGGPCANSVARAVTGLVETFPECAAGVQAGEAIIKLLDTADGMATGKVAMLVYGFNAKDTRLAAQVVANYKDYAAKFKGKELKVTGTSLTDVVIGAPITG